MATTNERKWSWLDTHNRCSACDEGAEVRMAWLGRLMVRLCRPCRVGLLELLGEEKGGE